MFAKNSWSTIYLSILHPVYQFLVHTLNLIHYCIILQMGMSLGHHHVVFNIYQWTFEVDTHESAAALGAKKIGFATSISYCLRIDYVVLFVNLNNDFILF